jgi:hypothetical protein
MTDRLPDFGVLFRAFARLKPTDDVSRREIANLLGFDLRERVAPPPPPEPPPLPILPPLPPAGDEAVPETRSPAAPQATTLDPFNTDLRPSVLRPIASTARPPNWGTAPPLPPPPAKIATRPPPEPLLKARWTRGILSAALSRRSAEGEIDIAAIVRTIGEACPFRSVPRQSVACFGRGVQLLVDAAEAMAPFAEDQEWLTERIRVVAGRDRTEVLGIDGSQEPFVAGPGIRLDWADYFVDFVPPAGVVAILLTDLGIGRMPLAPSTSSSRWLTFAEKLHKCGVPLIAIVPYARDRWPAALESAIPILQWDTRTTARAARRAIEKGLRRRHDRSEA